MNHQTERKGIETVNSFEEAQGRTTLRVHKCGYDLISRGPNEERHIEVKATAKETFTNRWLEELEWQCAQNDPLFYLYLVTNVESDTPKVFVMDRQTLLSKYVRQVSHYLFKFSPQDFVA